jgi:hypothetical protein
MRRTRAARAGARRRLARRRLAHWRLAHLHGAVAGVEHGCVGRARIVQSELPQRPRPCACRGARSTCRWHACSQTAPWPHNDRQGRSNLPAAVILGQTLFCNQKRQPHGVMHAVATGVHSGADALVPLRTAGHLSQCMRRLQIIVSPPVVPQMTSARGLLSSLFRTQAMQGLCIAPRLLWEGS